MRIKYWICLLGCLFLAECNNALPTCAETYGLSLNLMNQINANFQISLSMRKLGSGMELDLLFVFNDLPVTDADKPRLIMTNKEFRFALDGSDNFIDMFYDVHFHLERKIPNIGRISIRYASETVVVCENTEDISSGKVFVKIIESFRSNETSEDKISNYNESIVLKCNILDHFPFRYCRINATLEENSQSNVVVESGIPGEQVDILEISGTVYRLSSVFCDKFPNLMGLDANEVSLKFIDQNAFHKCTKMRKLNLISNKLTYISPIVFEKSNKLQVLNLQHNQMNSPMLTCLKYLPNLQMLRLETNKSFQFDIDEIPVMEHLRHLDLRGIQIKGVHDKNMFTTDGNSYSIPPIEEEKILKKFPNLKILDLAEGGTESAELNRLKEFFVKHGVQCCTSSSHFVGGI